MIGMVPMEDRVFGAECGMRSWKLGDLEESESTNG